MTGQQARTPPGPAPFPSTEPFTPTGRKPRPEPSAPKALAQGREVPRTTGQPRRHGPPAHQRAKGSPPT